MNGQTSSSNIWWRCSATIFRWLLALYPRQFRAAYSAQMLQDFRDLWEDAALRGGALGVYLLCCNTLGDLIGTAIAERLRKDRAMKHGSVARIIAALVLATAVLATLSMQSINLPLPVEMHRFLSLYWTLLSYNVAFLLGLVGLLLKYRRRMPWYISLIGSVAVLAFFCWRFLPQLLNQWVYLMSGNDSLGLDSIYYNYSAKQIYRVFFAIYLVYTAGMVAWGISTLVKRVLSAWIAVLLMLIGVDSLLWLLLIQLASGLPLDSLLQGPNFSTWGPPHLSPGFAVFNIPTLVYWTPYAFVHCLLLAGLGYALWARNRPGRAPSAQGEVQPAPQGFADGVGPAI